MSFRQIDENKSYLFIRALFATFLIIPVVLDFFVFFLANRCGVYLAEIINTTVCVTDNGFLIVPRILNWFVVSLFQVFHAN